MSTFLTIAVCTVVGVWILCAGGVILALCKVSAIDPPRPGTTKAQQEWFIAAAKVAHRRAS